MVLLEFEKEAPRNHNDYKCFWHVVMEYVRKLLFCFSFENKKRHPETMYDYECFWHVVMEYVRKLMVSLCF